MNRIEIVIGSTKTIEMQITYKTIKWILKDNIKKNVRNLWTWKQGKDENFTCIYKSYNDDLPIYTPQQLLDKIDETIKEQLSSL
tara:strand:+ start:673 stop:924 length:252 start_codon:yes stop_codon:yes gene_type:complete